MSDLLFDSFVYIILALVFFTIMLFFVNMQMNGASFWSDFHAKKIAEAVNYAKPGDVFALEIQNASQIAVKNNVANLNEMVVFENDKRKVCVKLSPGMRSCYAYFNDVDIVNKRIVYADPINKVYFEVKPSEVKNG